MRAAFAATILLLIGLALAAPAAQAQMTTDDLVDPGPRDAAVGSALRWERVQDEVKYLRPGAAFKPGEDIKVVIPPQPQSQEAERDGNRLTTGIVVFLAVAAVIVVFVLFGNRINVSFGKTSEEKRQREEGRRGLAVAGGGDLPDNGLLDRLAAMSDRREALILLTGHALERAARMNGMTLARAQTARDVLRSLPRQWHHMGAMRRLVREAEIVHFGGRDLAEDTWRACLDAARPLFGPEGTRA